MNCAGGNHWIGSHAGHRLADTEGFAAVGGYDRNGGRIRAAPPRWSAGSLTAAYSNVLSQFRGMTSMKSAFKVIAVIALATSSLVSVARHLAARVVD